jgi:hypothetical protein
MNPFDHGRHTERTPMLSAVNRTRFVVVRTLGHDHSMNTVTDTSELEAPELEAPELGIPAGQLVLLQGGGGPTDRDWLLDERTRRAGRYGILRVRETMRRLTPPQPVEHPSAVA